MRRKIISLSLLAPLVSACASTYQSSEQSSTPQSQSKPVILRNLTKAEKDILTKGFVQKLKDPQSARFQWAKIPTEPAEDGHLYYCGMVNAKNSFGGYVGYKPFFAIVALANGRIFHGVIGAIASDLGDDKIIADMCKKKGLDPFASI